MKSKTLKLIVTCGLFLFPALSARASVDSTLRLDIKCYYQLKTSSSGGKDTGIVKVIRLDTKQLLVLLSTQLNIKYTGGSQLEIATDGRVFVTDSKDNRLGDVSTYFHADIDTKSRIYDGSRNILTNQQITRNYFPISFTINLPELKVTFSGIANELYKVTAPNGDDVQIFTGHTDANVSGSGNFGGMIAHFTGTLALDGRKAVIKK
ncbi:MAG: hypothetical protein ABI600_13440 [Luteolibacter sp.]